MSPLLRLVSPPRLGQYGVGDRKFIVQTHTEIDL